MVACLVELGGFLEKGDFSSPLAELNGRCALTAVGQWWNSQKENILTLDRSLVTFWYSRKKDNSREFSAVNREIVKNRHGWS